MKKTKDKQYSTRNLKKVLSWWS